MSSFANETQLTNDSQLTDMDSQLTIAKGVSSDVPFKLTPSVLSLPSNISSMRQQAFALTTPLTWTQETYDTFWPFVDNIWVHNHTERKTKHHTIRSHYYCRLWKNDADQKPKGRGQRSKRMRNTEPCPMKLVMVKTFDATETDRVLTVTLDLHLSKKLELSHQSQHNHSLEELDGIKINSALKITAGGEVAKGYTPAVVNRNMQGVQWQGNFEALKAAGGVRFNLMTVHNASQNFKKANPDVRLSGATAEWQHQLSECVHKLKAGGVEFLAAKFEANRLDGGISHAVAFAKQSRLRTLMRRGHLTLMDSTHHTNALKWKLFTLMVRDECGSWIPGAHMLASNEDGNLIGAFLRIIKEWSRGWRLRYMITDDSAAEQRGVSLAFRGLIDSETEVSHFLCRTHSERTLNRKLSGPACLAAKKHLYDALYFRKTEMGCDDSIKQAMKAAPINKRAYIEREWAATKKQWAGYARQHSCLLLQCMTTNAVESWHASIKKHANGTYSSPLQLRSFILHINLYARQSEG